MAGWLCDRRSFEMTEGNGMWNSVMELVNGGFVLDIVAILDGIKGTFLIVYIAAICGYSGVNYGDGELFRNSSNLLRLWCSTNFQSEWFINSWIMKDRFFFFSIIDIIYVSIFGWSFLGYFYLLIFIFEALYNLVFLFLIRWFIHTEKCNKITRL